MTDSSYPLGKDELREFVEGVDDMVAQDLNDLFDVAVAIEEELGVDPSGDLGTITGRLFARGNLSKNDGKWRRLQWGIIGNLNGYRFDELAGRYKLSYTVNRWRGFSTSLGDDRPIPFMMLQPTGLYRAGIPWQISCFSVTESEAEFWGRDGNMARLSTANSRSDARVAYVLWGMG